LFSSKQGEIAGQETADDQSLLLEETIMDFIERIFGISPDGGSGTLEFLFLPCLSLVFTSFTGCAQTQENGSAKIIFSDEITRCHAEQGFGLR